MREKVRFVMAIDLYAAHPAQGLAPLIRQDSATLTLPSPFEGEGDVYVPSPPEAERVAVRAERLSREARAV